MKKSNRNIGRILMPVLYGVVLLVSIVVLVMGILEGQQEVSFWLKGGLVIVSLTAALIASLTGGRTRKNFGSKKNLYHVHYGEFIGRAFETDAKAEKQFIKAVDCYAHDKPADGLPLLKKLYDQYPAKDDRYAVVTFMALCLHDMQVYQKAIKMYIESLQMKPNSTIASNLGLCYERNGDYTSAIEAYKQAIAIDPDNAFAYNNMAVVLIRQSKYADALQYAECAVRLNQRMPQALNSMAVCCYMLNKTEEYQQYYRRAVSAGADGDKLKAYLKSLDTTV